MSSEWQIILAIISPLLVLALGVYSVQSNRKLTSATTFKTEVDALRGVTSDLRATVKEWKEAADREKKVALHAKIGKKPSSKKSTTSKRSSIGGSE